MPGVMLLRWAKSTIIFTNMDPTLLGTEVERCSLCGGLPDDLMVNTGREQRFPGAFYQLVPLGFSYKRPFRRCPECGTFFHWIDLPQTYGTGNCDEERSIRLSAKVSRLLDRLFPPDPQNPGDLGEAAEYFEGLPLDLLVQALRTHVIMAPQIVTPFVPGLVQLLGETNDSYLKSLLSSYHYDKPEHAEEILEAFLSMDERCPPRLTYLLRECLMIVLKRMRTP